MTTTRKQKEARKSRGAEMLSDIKNLDIMLGGNHLEKEESEYCCSSRRSNNPNFNVHENNEENHYPNPREIDQVTVPNMGTIVLAPTLVLSLIDYQVKLT